MTNSAGQLVDIDRANFPGPLHKINSRTHPCSLIMGNAKVGEC